MSSSVISLVKNTAEAPSVQDMLYARKAYEIMIDALQKGCDVAQMPNGDLLVTEVKTVTYKYNWDESRNRFERAASGKRKRREAKESAGMKAVPARKVS